MIPQHIAEIADLIFPNWAEDDETRREVVKAAQRIWYAGYRRGDK